MKDLIKKARDGNPDAFTELMKLQMPAMYKTARAILHNEDDAADAISETILVCWEKIAGLQEVKYFRTWMTRILINKCNDLLRKKKHLLFSEQIPDVKIYEDGFLNAEWNQALESIDEKYRLLIILRYVNGFQASEISKMLNIPCSTIYTRLSRARRMLADKCAPKPEKCKSAAYHNSCHCRKERSL